MNCTIYIIRHGQTDLNKKHVLQGRSDYPLNETGHGQAEAAGQMFRRAGIRFDRIWSSPLQRAMDTAIIASGQSPNTPSAGGPASLSIRTDDRLLEMDYGPYEGTDLLDPPPEITEFFSDFSHNPAPEGMEPLDHIVQRLGSFLEDLRQSLTEEAESDEEAGSDLSIMISTHAIAMKGALEYLSPDSHGAYWSKHIANCEVYVSRLADGEFSVPQPLRIRQG